LIGLGISAQDFTVIKTDNTKFPKVTLQIKSNEANVSGTDFSISNETEKISFEFEEIEKLASDAPKAVLIMLDASGISEDSVFSQIKKSTLSAISFMNRRDLLNVGFLGLRDSINSRPNYISAEFSDDHRLICESMLAEKFDKPYHLKNKSTILESVQQILEFVQTRQAKTSEKSLFILCGKVSDVNSNILKNCISDSKKYNIPIYITTSEKLNKSTEKILARLCSETGGVYTNTDLQNLDSFVVKNMEDIGLTHDDNKIYSISFNASKQGKFEIFFKGTKKIIEISPESKYMIFARNFIQNPVYPIFSILIILACITLIFRKKPWMIKIFTRLKSQFRNNPETIEIKETRAFLQTFDTENPVKFILENEITVIGRDSSCNICLPDETVSKRHAEIEIKKGRFIISDEGSTNGIYVNGKKTVKTQLRKNDIIQVGKTRLKIKI
jgi:hypothetical protein